MRHVTKSSLNFEREPLAAPFGFKGGYLTELWQIAARLESETGNAGLGLGVQSVLWSDSSVFASCDEAAGNCLMLLMSSYALKMMKEIPFETPIDLQEKLLPIVHEYGKIITQRSDLRLTFALNSLVAVDNAAWLLTAKENGWNSFEQMIPAWAVDSLSFRNEKIASVPAVGYGMSIKDIIRLTEQGYFVLKIKIGSDPAKDGDQEKMLAWDMARMETIHLALKGQASGKERQDIKYYLDANGRYDSKDRIFRLLDHLAKIGALEQTILLEEPFPEDVKMDVHDIPVCIVADESAHTDRDAAERIDLGYGAIALKPVAKTLSMSFKIARVAYERGVPCFCADLTVNPILVEWNKVMASRLKPLPGMEFGIMENNGWQNYKHWDRLMSTHPCASASWTKAEKGFFNLNDDFFERSGGIFISEVETPF